MSKQQKIPKLRFSGFNGEWEVWKLGELGDFKNGLNKSKEEFGFGSPFVNLMDVFGKISVSQMDFGLVNSNENEKANYNLKKGDVLFIRSSVKRQGVGEASVILEDLKDTVYSGFLIRFRERVGTFNLHFKKYCFATEQIRDQILSLSTTSANTNINQDSLNGISIEVPTLPEQQKIAHFLTSIDEKINQLTRQKALLEQYKKGVMQRIFSRELRFRDGEGRAFGDWEVKKLGEVAKRVTKKNTAIEISHVLTNSAVQGIVNQQDYFDKDIANQDNLQGYYIVEVDDFIYNPRISNAAPVGPIKRNNLVTGVMSPLYTVFRFEKNMNLRYFEVFFETTHWHKYMNEIANFGARHDRMSITNDDFIKMPIPYPTLPEQQKIADFLSALDEKIARVSGQVEAVKGYKKGLLQGLFV